MSSKWIVRLVIIAGVGLVIATIFRLLTPSTPTIPASDLITTNTDGTQTNFSNVVYSGPEIEVPPRMEIASVQVQEIPVVDQLIQDFQLQRTSTTFQVWRGPQYSLTYSSQINQYTLSLNQPAPPGSAPLNPGTAQEVAKTFVAQYFGGTNLQLLENNIRYTLEEGDSQVPVSQAQAAVFPFSYSLQGFPVVLGQTNLLPVTVTVNQANQLVKAVFTPANLQLTPRGSKNTLSVETAVENINQGQASITRAFQENFQPIDLASIVSGDMVQGTLQYRMDAQSQLVFPFYVFSGVVINSQNVPINAEISTPAVAIE